MNIDHIVLRTSDFDRASGFYRELFEFAEWVEVPDLNSENCVGFRHSDGFTIWLEEVEQLDTGGNLGWLDHYGLKCESRTEVDRAYEFCVSRGWTILTEPKAYPEYGDFYGFSFRGPDGIKLEFVTR